MNILALDNAGVSATVGLWADGVMRYDARFPAGRGEGGALFAALREALALCPVPDRIVTGLGPGSYSGIRVAVSAAYGIELATGATLSGLPSIAALDVPETHYTVVGDVRRGSYFHASVNGGRLVTPIQLLSREDLQEQRAGELFKAVYTLDSEPGIIGCRAAIVSAEKLVLCYFQTADTNLTASSTLLQPLYLKPPYISKPK